MDFVKVLRHVAAPIYVIIDLFLLFDVVDEVPHFDGVVLATS